MTGAEAAAQAARPGPLARALARVRASSRSERLAALGLTVSFALTALLPLTDARRYGDLNNWFTDHLHHAFAAWLFLHRGLDLYRLPFAQIWSHSGYHHPIQAWGQMPGLVYPPGTVALFLPLSFLGQYVPMSAHALGVIAILYLLVISHLAFAAVLKALATQPPGLRWLVGALAYVLLIHLALQGFSNAAWIGCGAMMVAALGRGRPVVALRWFGAAALLHFHAVILVPLAAGALWQAVRGRGARQWPWPDLIWVGCVGLLDLYLASLAFPATAGFRRMVVTLLMRQDLAFWTVVAVSVCAAIASGLLADLAVALMVAIAAVVAVTDYPYWWHGSLMLMVPLAVGAVRRARGPARARVALVLWLVWIQPLAWRDPVTQILPELVERLQHNR